MKATIPFLLAAALAACASPEASRVRGGGPGADVGNRRPVVQLHLGAKPYHDTPCRTTDVRCTGPKPDLGTTLD
ncbi:MAG: hypothetical protein IRZ00_08260 [Gemmatimonadetes bacterium]|nr:hypothetical protein [Gemmatimonadota bacterium]